MNKIVKEHFKNYGLSKSVLKQLESLVLASAGEEVEDENKLKEVCTNFDNLAKTMQSDIDARVTRARKEVEGESQNTGSGSTETDDEAPKTDLDKVLAQLNSMQEKLNNLEKEKVTNSFIKQAEKRLKEFKMRETEVKSALYGRKFQTEEELEDFIEVQEELYAEIVKERISAETPADGEPSGNGSVSAKAFEKQLEEYNKRN